MKLAGVYVLLIVLLASTYGVSFFNLGAANFWINVAIAVAKAALVVTFFMRIRSTALARSVLLASLCFLAILYWLAANDYFTRAPAGTPARPVAIDR
jgi:cytochrome c oxidase subunit IV